MQAALFAAASEVENDVSKLLGASAVRSLADTLLRARHDDPTRTVPVHRCAGVHDARRGRCGPFPGEPTNATQGTSALLYHAERRIHSRSVGEKGRVEAKTCRNVAKLWDGTASERLAGWF